MPWLRPTQTVSRCSKGAPLERGQKSVHVGDQEIGGAGQLDVEAGIEHVGRGHALVHEARFGTHDLREMGQEGDHVMLGHRLDLVDARHVEDGILSLFPDLRRRRLGDYAELRQAVGGMGLDLEPDAEAGLRFPDGSHFGAGIAGDHGGPFVVSGAGLTNPLAGGESRSQFSQLGSSKGTAMMRRFSPSKPRL